MEDYSLHGSAADYDPNDEEQKKKDLDDTDFLNKQEQEDDEQLKIIL